MRKILSLFLVIGLTGGLAGCGELTGLTSDVQGTYYLYSVNGERLPYSLGYDDFGIESVVVDGQLTMRSNGTFEEIVDFDEYEYGSSFPVREVRERDTGTYSGSRSNLVLRYDRTGYRYDAEYSGGDIIIYADGAQVLYRRQ